MNLFSIILLGVIFIYLIFSIVYIYKNKKMVRIVLEIVAHVLKIANERD